jgi:hypothetical protein
VFSGIDTNVIVSSVYNDQLWGVWVHYRHG